MTVGHIRPIFSVIVDHPSDECPTYMRHINIERYPRAVNCVHEHCGDLYSWWPGQPIIRFTRDGLEVLNGVQVVR